MIKNEKQSTMQQLETFEDFVHILHKSSHPSYAIKSEQKYYFHKYCTETVPRSFPFQLTATSLCLIVTGHQSANFSVPLAFY